MISEPEYCPYCDGSGESTVRVGGGPDVWDEPCVCPRCKGAQTLRAAYETLAEELPPLQLKVAQLGIFHSHATRYGWAPNQKTGMDSFAEKAAEWLAANRPSTPAPDLLAALTQLAFMARTSGTPTPELLRACEGAEALIAKTGGAL